jgi:NADPH-dependent curcumin reductase CurA
MSDNPLGQGENAFSNRVLKLAHRPTGVPVFGDWQVMNEPVPAPKFDECVVAVDHISIDPAMRGWLDDVPSYLPPVRLNTVMRAIGVGRVVRSLSDRFPVGTAVMGMLGVQRFALVNAAKLTAIDTSLGSPRSHLGVLGQTGLTAFFGLFEIGMPKAGDTVVVSAAAGAVGSVVGQLARLSGCRVIGIAGGAKKCLYIRNELGFDEAIDYKSEDVGSALKTLCPSGIDVYFDNVGGPTLEAVLNNLALKARIVICGAISQYNATELPAGPNNLWKLLVRRASMQGFLVFDHADEYPQARARLADWVARGSLLGAETVVDGTVDDFPHVFLRLFQGENMGKLILSLEVSNG